MPNRPKKPRRPLGFFDAQAKYMHLTNVYRAQAMASTARSVAHDSHSALDDVPTAEPDEELEDSELSDSERNAAIARERTRREGRA
ncbi:MAG TPA: hypothetical protein VI759_04695 [Dehalococcoidia bacterium]|nr:hypothetical protein [Dehalococcoidia bacterium]